VEGFRTRKVPIARLATAGAPARVLLASQEREMIRMMADGVSLRGIARRLELREIEVRAYLASIFEKLAISGRLELLSPKEL
jgi:DNA-binding NarL/FixJ family response regulator